VYERPIVQPTVRYAASRSHQVTLIGSRPLTWSAEPPTSGKRNWPPGTFEYRPANAAATANASVARNGRSVNAVVPGAFGDGVVLCCVTRCVTNDAVRTTNVTRRYCMNATIRASAP